MVFTTDTNKFTWANDSMGILRVSDTFTSQISSSVPNYDQTRMSGYIDLGYIDYVKYKDFVIISDGMGMPKVFMTEKRDPSANPDTIMYEPHFIDLGLPRPGEPRVRVIDTGATTTLSGLYEYCYGLRALSPFNTVAGCMGDTSYNSIVINPQDKCVMIDGFMGLTYSVKDTTQIDSISRASQIYLFRRKVNNVEEQYIPDTGQILASDWKYVDTYWMKVDEHLVIIDSGQTRNDSTFADFTVIPSWFNAVVGMPRRKGAWLISSADSNATINGYGADSMLAAKTFEYVDSNVTVGWSWYDPITELESKMSRKSVADHIVWDTGVYKYRTVWTLPYLDSIEWVTNFVRIYRSVFDNSLPGFSDTSVVYCVYQLGLVDSWNHAYEGYSFLMGGTADSLLVREALMGEIDQYMEITRYDSTQDNDFLQVGLSFTGDNDAYNESGSKIIRKPDASAPCRIPFKDMDYINGRLWGIGDPLYPQRLYYSGYEDMNNWDVNFYLSLDENENDEIVAIEKIEGPNGDHVIAFKHNSIYDASGVDPEYDLSINRITSEYGALNRSAVKRVNNDIYFMSTEERIYSLSSRGVEWISFPIQDYVDSLFTSDDSIAVFELTDKVIFTARNKTLGVAYNYLSKTWSIESWSFPTNSIYIGGSIRYDSLQNQRGFGKNSYWVYEDATYNPTNDSDYIWFETSVTADTVRRDPVGGEAGGANEFPFVYQTPFIQDGESIYQAMWVTVTAKGDSGKTMGCVVVNEEGSVLDSSNVTFDNRTHDIYTISFDENEGAYLALRFSGRIIEISNIKIKARKVGRATLN
jgi:hypothetical protein